MTRFRSLAVIFIGALALVSIARAHEEGKFHHDLRGKIVAVDPAKNEFTIRTNQGEVAVCFVDSKTVLRRGRKNIGLDDVRPGDRAYCHCAAMNEGKHYSVQLVLEKGGKK